MKTIGDLSILIVEDEPFQCAIIAEKRRELGCVDIHNATDGIDAIKMLKARVIDLIFLRHRS